MSLAFRGRQLELAIARAGRDYRAERRAVIVRQHPPMGTGDDGLLIHVGGAPVDFLGARSDGQALAIEAKETQEASFPLEQWPEHERTALVAFYGMGASAALIVDFCRTEEVYGVSWAAVAAFLAAPWRKSLTVDWCRAHGLWLPDRNRGTDRRRVLWLDGVNHPDRPGAAERVEEERRASKVLTLDVQEAAADKRDETWTQRRKDPKAAEWAALMARRPSKDSPDYLAWLNEFSAAMLAADSERAKRNRRAPKWGRKRE